MILTCPACATSYFVPDTAIGQNGRRVRCKSCGHDWRASLEDEPLELTPGTDPEADATREAAPEPAPESLAETPAPELPKAFRAKAEQKRRMKKAATLGAAWVAGLVVLMGVVGALIAYRLPVVEAWPQTASFYKAIGFPVNLAGVEVEALRGRTLLNAPNKVIIGGALRNIRDHEVVPPGLIIILRDERGVEVVRHPLELEGPPILPGKVQGFAAVVENPDNQGSGISIDFALNQDRAPAAAKAQAKAAPAPKSRPLPVAEEEGLRSANTITDVPQTSTPIDKKGP